MTDIEVRVRRVLQEMSENPIFETADPDAKLTELGLDSILFVRSVVTIEEEFGIEFEDDALYFGRFETLQSLLDYVKERLVTRKGGERAN